MRPAILLPLVAMLLASPLAMAQRASLADRVAALEARGAGDQNGVALVNQVSALQAEVQALRGQLEELQQQLEQARQSQRVQYLDLSGRLDRLEGGAPAPAAASQPGEPVAVATPPVALPAPPVAVAQDEQGAYAHAFEALKSGDYVESARRLRDFLAAYPAGQLAPNAIYWLGESYYVTQNYALAADQFRALLDRYPANDKAPGALLKLGLAQSGLRQNEAAMATLRQVAQRYPGSDAARIADDRLRSMQLAGNR